MNKSKQVASAVKLGGKPWILGSEKSGTTPCKDSLIIFFILLLSITDGSRPSEGLFENLLNAEVRA